MPRHTITVEKMSELIADALHMIDQHFFVRRAISRQLRLKTEWHEHRIGDWRPRLPRKPIIMKMQSVRYNAFVLPIRATRDLRDHVMRTWQPVWRTPPCDNVHPVILNVLGSCRTGPPMRRSVPKFSINSLERC